MQDFEAVEVHCKWGELLDCVWIHELPNPVHRNDDAPRASTPNDEPLLLILLNPKDLASLPGHAYNMEEKRRSQQATMLLETRDKRRSGSKLKWSTKTTKRLGSDVERLMFWL